MSFGEVARTSGVEASAVPGGAVVQMFLRKSNEGVTGAVPNEGVMIKSLLAYEGVCQVRYAGVWYGGRTPYLLAWGAGASEFYDEYAWVERDGSAGWVRLPRVGELATAQVYGAMMYGTDMRVVNGAPVGRDASGRAHVPLASSTVPGAIRPSSGEVSDVGGGTHVSVTGTLLTDVATPGRFGSVKLGTSNVITSGALVGVNANGQMMVPMATLGTAGVFRLGTQYPTDPGDGYRVGVGAYNNQLCIAFVPGGALRHWRPATWAGSGMDWIRDVSWSSEDSYFTCLLTTDQFGQDGERGLSLKTATTERLAGVFLASGEEDVRGNAVPSMQQVNKRFAPRDSVYDREESEQRFLMKSDTVDEIRQLTLSEYQALRARNPKCLYLVTED